MNRTAMVVAVLIAATLATPATAVSAVPAPTASATFHTVYVGLDSGPANCDPAPYSFTQAALTASWSVARAGKDATLTVKGTPQPVFAGCAQGSFTSVPLQLRSTGKVATVALSWSAVQLDPYDSGSKQTVSARFGDGRSHWGPWVNYFRGELTAPRDTGTEHQALVPITYRGTVPAKNVVLQVRVQDDLYTPTAQLQQTAHVTIG